MPRRSLDRMLFGVATAAVGILCNEVTLSSASAAAVRMSWQDFAKDPKRVASLRNAVAAMKKLNSADHASVSYRKSWEYWANIHGYFGPDSPFGTLAENMAGIPQSDRHFFNGVSDMTAPDQTARDLWAQCQHGTPWFFAWHRLYLLYFEKQLQAASGDPGLRLPYWDYTDPAHLAMPAEFTQPTYKDTSGSDKPNPLFEPRRAPGWQSGREKLNANSTTIDNWLRQTNFTTYQSGIEGNVHGYIHCSVSTSCPVVDMGAVPYSSNDPIFWLHHANIDRMWSCWSSIPRNKNPSDSGFTNQSYSFVDTSGQKVSNKVGDLFNGTLVDYKYEQETGCARSNATRVAATTPTLDLPTLDAKLKDMIERRTLLNKPIEPVHLTAATTKVKVELQRQGDLNPLFDLLRTSRAAVPVNTHLILGGITFASPPGVQFYVYLEDPTNPSRREYAGTLSFFGAAPGGARTRHHHGTNMDATLGLTRDFDVTDALRKLGKVDLASITVAFEATNGRVGSTQAPEINEKAALTVKSVDFRLTAAE